jgi:prepilin-type N-terminal cleavage/methylation domain-containing protein
MRIPVRSDRRAGMTAIEILVVIAIIAVLAALLLGGVMLVFSKGSDAANRQDMNKLSDALEHFNKDHNMYPPSRILLLPTGNAYSTAHNQLATASLAYLTKVWPNLDLNTNIPWAGNVMTIPASGIVLDGDQCLVFFLGGIPDSTGAVIGFAENPANPADPTFPLEKRKRYFEFDPGRLYNRESGNPFPSYKDQYSIGRGAANPQPFVYFSSNSRTNGYDKPLMGQSSVIPSLSLSPYVDKVAPATTYHLPTKYQLISAGRDGQFGPGGPGWSPSTANTIPTAGRDDMTNFYDALMGVTN